MIAVLEQNPRVEQMVRDLDVLIGPHKQTTLDNAQVEVYRGNCTVVEHHSGCCYSWGDTHALDDDIKGMIPKIVSPVYYRGLIGKVKEEQGETRAP
jgi:hypothetical protein